MQKGTFLLFGFLSELRVWGIVHEKYGQNFQDILTSVG